MLFSTVRYIFLNYTHPFGTERKLI